MSVTVEIVELSTSQDRVGRLVSFRLEVDGSDQDVLVPADGGAFSARDTAGDVAVLRVPLTITGGSGEAPPQVEARLVPAGESVSLEEDGAVAVADETTTVHICVERSRPCSCSDPPARGRRGPLHRPRRPAAHSDCVQPRGEPGGLTTPPVHHRQPGRLGA